MGQAIQEGTSVDRAKFYDEITDFMGFVERRWLCEMTPRSFTVSVPGRTKLVVYWLDY